MQKIIEGMLGAISVTTVLIYIVAVVSIIVGIIVAIRMRIKEKASGEEDEAKKY